MNVNITELSGAISRRKAKETNTRYPLNMANPLVVVDNEGNLELVSGLEYREYMGRVVLSTEELTGIDESPEEIAWLIQSGLDNMPENEDE